MRIKNIMSIILLYLLALFCMIACSSAGSSQGSKIEPDKVTSENKTDNSSQNSESTDTPMENHMSFHSWEELKLLCDATQGDSDQFLEALKILDEQYCPQKKTHLWLEEVSDKARYKDTFSNICGRIKDEKIVILKEQKNVQGTIQSSDISIRSIGIRQPSVNIYTYISYQCSFADKLFILSVNANSYGSFTNAMQNEEGEAFIKILGEGYSADVWLASDAYNRYQSYHAYITEDGYSYPGFYVTISPEEFKGSTPEELLSLLENLRITTVEEILENIDS